MQLGRLKEAAGTRAPAPDSSTSLTWTSFRISRLPHSPSASLTTPGSFQTTNLASFASLPVQPLSPMFSSSEPAPPPVQPPDHSLRRELEHGQPLHFFSDPRAEEQDIEMRPSPEEETVVGTPTPSWIEGADGEKQEVIFVCTAAAPVGSSKQGSRTNF